LGQACGGDGDAFDVLEIGRLALVCSMNKTHVFRLVHGNDLRKGIEAVAMEEGILAGWIGCGVGSLTRYNIRFANKPEGSRGEGYFEIVSLTGTVSVNGSHIHISISDDRGQTIGGHLLDGNVVYTTAEIVIQEEDGFVFTRENDGSTQWKELQIKKNK
jgi:uncharacterized protein